MLALAPGSACDVCAEEYSSRCLPHSLPCGHVLCSSCSDTITDKTPPRLTPLCPFCREQFNNVDVRLIRLDLTSSGWSTPKRPPVPPETHLGDSTSAAWNRHMERAASTDPSGSRARAEARRFEDKVAQIASKKSSVDDVTALQKELKTWLNSGVKYEDKKSLQLSEALLRAILINNVSHTDAVRVARSVETNLKSKVEHLEGELRRYHQQYSHKSQECESLRVELSRFKVPSTPATPERSASPPPLGYHRPPSASPIPPMPYNTPTSNVSRFNSVHSRSSSMSSHSPARTSTSSHLRSSTPAPTPSTRSYTPSSISRSQTPGPAPAPYRSQTPAPPVPTISRSRRQSISAALPQKIGRTSSEEKDHKRWVPFVESEFKSSASAQSRSFSRDVSLTSP